MDFYTVLLIPAIWGLIGFFEPCSIGTNTLFLTHLKQKQTKSLLKEVFLFTIIRAFTLAILGLVLAYVGRELFVFERGYFIVLGILYLILGIAAILNTRYPILKNINLQKIIGNNRNTAHLGVIFGLTIPACALPFIIALIGTATLSFSILEGFLSFFIFGLMLSLPLFYFGLAKSGIQFLGKIGKSLNKLPYLVGFILALIGILTIMSNVWWK